MKYLLAFVVAERGVEGSTPAEMQEAMEAWNAFDQEAIDKGAFIACEPLESPSSAITLRLQGEGEQVVVDGPFSEAKEQLGGFALLECENLDEALEWARKVPLRSGAIEVRQVLDLSQFGYESKTLTPARATA